ncbi:MAG TPA: glycosyltransferase family 39 protein, partial [Anaerolineaceae bacterium]|nr:glycosyltransferase family 39 protein [Anaerolineaceae bacterium]
MSSEIARLCNDPSSVFWSAQKEGDLRQHYRVIDAPLMRYVLEAARAVAGVSTLEVDWDWSQSWEKNRQAGALPDRALLQTGRWGAAIFFPFDLILIFAIGRRIQGRLTGWLAALLLAGNALVLLHTRRAMAEGLLLFTTLLATWAMVTLHHRPWLTGLPVALAVNSKHSAVALLVPGLLAAFWPQPERTNQPQRIVNVAGFLGLFAITMVVLNPFLWTTPLRAAQQVWQARSRLTENMTLMISTASPEMVQKTIPERIGAEVTQLYFTRPAVMDVANYADQLHTAEQSYLANPFHTLFRDIWSGGLLLGAALFGMILAARRILFDLEGQGGLVLLLVATLSM